MTVTEPRWSDDDRAAVLALLEEERETCPSCHHQMSECRDPRTAGTWTVVTERCEPSAIAQAVAENEAEKQPRVRGLQIYTLRTEGHG